jgi:hypothetical protein
MGILRGGGWGFLQKSRIPPKSENSSILGGGHFPRKRGNESIEYD